jgi:predicted MFS family arabinose efflux permease
VTGWRRILLLASAVGFLEALLFAAIVPLLPRLEEDLELSKAGAGLLTSAYAAGALLGAVPSIWAARRLGVRTTVVAGLLLLAASSAAFVDPGSAWLVFAARIGQGAGSAFAYTGALSWLTTVAPPTRRGEAIGVAFGAIFMGELAGPLAGAAAAGVGLPAVFVAVAVVTLVLAGLATGLHAPPTEHQPRPSLRSLAAVPVVRLGTWLIALAAIALGILGVLSPLRLDELGWNATAIGLAFAIAAVLQAVVNPIVGRVADARGDLVPLRVAVVLAAGASTLLVLDDRALVYAGTVVAAGVAYAMLWTPALTLLSNGFEKRGFDQAFGFGLMSAAWPPGFAIGAAAGGALAAATADMWPYLLAAAACLVTLPLLRGGTVYDDPAT